MKPGECLNLKLVLNPINIFRKVSVPLCIQSTQMVETGVDGLQQVNTIKTWQQIEMNGLTSSKALFSTLFAVLIVAANTFWVIVLIKWLMGNVL